MTNAEQRQYEWTERIKDYRASGLTMSAWCEAQGVAGPWRLAGCPFFSRTSLALGWVFPSPPMIPPPEPTLTQVHQFFCSDQE